MKSVTVSSKYQIVIPRSLRESLSIHPGNKLQVIEYEGRLELLPVREMKEMRGFLAGIDTDVPREQDR